MIDPKKLGDALARAATASWDGDKSKLRDALGDAAEACNAPDPAPAPPADPPSS